MSKFQTWSDEAVIVIQADIILPNASWQRFCDNSLDLELLRSRVLCWLEVMQCLSMAWNICQVWQCDVRTEERRQVTGICEPWCQESGQLDSYYVTQGSQKERLHLLATDSVMAVITEEMRDDFTLHAGTRLSYAQIRSQKGSRKKGGCMFRFWSFRIAVIVTDTGLFETRFVMTLHSFTASVIYLQSHWVCDLESSDRGLCRASHLTQTLVTRMIFPLRS